MEETRVEALRRRVQQERETSGLSRPRFSKQLKREVAELISARGWSDGRASKALGLSESSIQRWAKRGTKSKPRVNASDFKKVAIVETKAERVTPDVTGGALSLELPCGSRVTGLTLAQVAELMRRQS